MASSGRILAGNCPGARRIHEQDATGAGGGESPLVYASRRHDLCGRLLWRDQHQATGVTKRTTGSFFRTGTTHTGGRLRRVRVGYWGMVLAAAASACGNATGPLSGDQILGSWDWEESSGGIAGTTITPESAGYTMTLEFTGSGEVEMVRGDVVASSGYRIVLTDDGNAERIVYDVSLLGFDTQEVTFVAGRLVLTDPCCDGFSYRFVRVP